MNNHEILPQSLLSDSLSGTINEELKAFCLESFAREVDHNIQNELLTRLILEHSSISRQLEVLYKRLSRSEEMLVEAQKIAMLGRWDAYRDSDELVWSHSLYEILEVDPTIPASPELFLSRVHPDDHDKAAGLYERIYSIDKSWTIRYRLMMEDGRIKWIHQRCNPTINSKGRVVHYYGTIQDITEMKKAEDKLEKYSKHLENLVEEKVREISASQMATIYALIKLSESRDDDTGTHIERTAGFCRLLSEKARPCAPFSAEIDDRFISTIHRASPLHDIGKVGIPDRILLKPGKLTEDEYAIMKTHVQIGYRTLATVGQQYDRNEFLKMGMDIALYHHEKWDGSGYNEGLSGEKIPLSARIMAIADVYDALRSRRVYKEAFSHEKSMEIMVSSRGSHFDPALFDLFYQANEEFRVLYESLK